MTAETLRFRIATPEDAPKIQELIQTAFRTEDTRERWTGSAELASQFHISADDVLASITDPDRAVLVATTEAHNSDTCTLVASVEASRRGGGGGGGGGTGTGTGGPPTARLSMLAVDQRRQRAGLGRRVLAHAEDYCRRAWGAAGLVLGLNALSTRGALIEWYVRCGFRRTGGTSAFPRDRFPGLALPGDLCFVELEKDLAVVAG
ncbi:hypothetical protein diail_10934 [Diaporthe ilicicola]|nr:hypothetical protein diail_10934 [Diaporthe ilicicola]